MLWFAWNAPDLGVTVPTKVPDPTGRLAFLVDWTVAALRENKDWERLVLRANSVLD